MLGGEAAVAGLLDDAFVEAVVSCEGGGGGEVSPGGTSSTSCSSMVMIWFSCWPASLTTFERLV